MAICPNCHTEVSTPEKTWKMTGANTRLLIGLFECPSCHKKFRSILKKEIIGQAIPSQGERVSKQANIAYLQEKIRDARTRRYVGISLEVLGVIIFSIPFFFAPFTSIELPFSTFIMLNAGGIAFFIYGALLDNKSKRQYSVLMRRLQNISSTSNCPKCGKVLPRGKFVFCPFCGNSLEHK